MSRAAASLDARWYRSSPTGWGLPSRGSAHNTLVQAVSDRPATHVGLAYLHRGKSPCLASLTVLTLRHHARSHLPDVAGVFRNGAVTRKLTGMAHIEDRFAFPGLGLRVQGAHLCLGFDIGRQIGKVSVVVSRRQEHVHDRGKNPGLVRAESIGGDHLEGATGFRLMVIVPMWVVPAAAVLHLFCRQAEEEKVLLASLLGHFDRSAVTRANGQGAVHHELHDTRAT